MDTLWLGARLLLLLAAANTTPIVLKRLLGRRWAAPIDGGQRFRDNRRWLGPSKTWRGLAGAVLAGALIAPILGFSLDTGALTGLLAMAGDAFASFLKRRLGFEPGAQAFGLDQIPEALLPLLALRIQLELPWALLLGVTFAFLLLEAPMAQLWYRMGLRDRPY